MRLALVSERLQNETCTCPVSVNRCQLGGKQPGAAAKGLPRTPEPLPSAALGRTPVGRGGEVSGEPVPPGMPGLGATGAMVVAWLAFQGALGAITLPDGQKLALEKQLDAGFALQVSLRRCSCGVGKLAETAASAAGAPRPGGKTSTPCLPRSGALAASHCG